MLQAYIKPHRKYRHLGSSASKQQNAGASRPLHPHTRHSAPTQNEGMTRRGSSAHPPSARGKPRQLLGSAARGHTSIRERTISPPQPPYTHPAPSLSSYGSSRYLESLSDCAIVTVCVQSRIVTTPVTVSKVVAPRSWRPPPSFYSQAIDFLHE